MCFLILNKRPSLGGVTIDSQHCNDSGGYFSISNGFFWSDYSTSCPGICLEIRDQYCKHDICGSMSHNVTIVFNNYFSCYNAMMDELTIIKSSACTYYCSDDGKLDTYACSIDGLSSITPKYLTFSITN